METEPSQLSLDEFVRQLPQIVPEEWCRDCRICCRFPDPDRAQLPTWSKQEAAWALRVAGNPGWFRPGPESPTRLPVLKPCGQGCRCPAFEPEGNRCTIYADRPLDCRLYPFVVTRNPGRSHAVLAMDLKCPFLQAHSADSGVIRYAGELARTLDSPEALAYLRENPALIGPSWPEYLPVAPLPRATAWVQPAPRRPHPALSPLAREDRGELADALGRREHAFSGYTPATLLGWSDLIRLWWTRLEGILCLFAEQGGGLYMPLPPLGAQVSGAVRRRVWEILEEANDSGGVSRIEGVETQELAQWEEAGFSIREGEQEYLYRRSDLLSLKGDRYRSQRWAINRCLRGEEIRLRPYEEEDLVPCLQLHTLWAIQRNRALPEGSPGRRLLRDSLFFHRRLIESHRELGVTGWLADTQGGIRGYTFGAPISPRIYCDFLEIADPSIPGLAQLLFRELCRQAGGYDQINTLGDCGLPGLRRNKLSCRPADFVRTFTVFRVK